MKTVRSPLLFADAAGHLVGPFTRLARCARILTEAYPSGPGAGAGTGQAPT